MTTAPALIITTSRRPTPELLCLAERFRDMLRAPLAPRAGSLADLCRRHDVMGVLVVGTERVIYHEPASGLAYFYHPGMVKVRLHSHKRGDPDPMVTAMGLGPGDSVLDCTLGRGSDAILCSWVVGEAGRVVGLEASPILAALTQDAIERHVDPSREITAALRRIEGLCADYRHHLPGCPTDSFEVVYFDPLFDEPLAASQAMAPLRALADPSPLSPEAVAEARRVAHRCVVIKQRKGASLCRELGVSRIVGSPKGRIEYGVLSVG